MQTTASLRGAGALPKATINSLPDELLAEIFYHLVHETRHRTSRCALVCRRWREPAQRALFSQFTLHGTSVADLQAWLDSPARTRYPTQRLTFGYGYPVKKSLEVIRACHGLRELQVYSVDPGELGGYSLFQTDQAKDIRSVRVWTLEDFPTDAAPVPCRLGKLVVFLDGEVTENAIKSILLSSRDTLHHLHLVADEPSTISLAALVDFLTANPFKGLQSLTIDKLLSCAQAPADSMNIIRAIPSLSALHFRRIPLSHILDDFKGVDSSPSQAIKHLTVDNTLQMSDSQREVFDITILLEIIRLPIFARLSQLGLPEISKSAMGGPAGLALLDECEERSISFKCRYGYL